MRKSLNKGIFSALICFFLCNVTNVQAVNTTSTVTWPFGTGVAGQVATYTSGTENYFSVNWVDKGSNLAYKDKTTNYTINYTRFQPLTTGAVDANNVVAFSIRPATGMSFTPTSISFDCMRYGTDGGSIDVAWKSSDGTVTSIATALKPARDNSGAGTHATYTITSAPASTGDCMLYIYIYSLGNTKQIGLANIVVNGNLSGDVIAVTKYAFSTSVSPATGGTVASFPVGTSIDAGTALTVTATRSFGHQFKEWRDASTDAVVSSTNPYTFTLNSDLSLKAVFDTVYNYSLILNTSGGAPTYLVTASPAATVVNGQNMYETGTTVTLTAANNSLLTFTNWLTGETNATKTVSMTQNQNITAVYSAVDYIVGWDFYKSGGSSRPADFYSTTDNQTSTVVLRKADGTVNSWLDKSMIAAGGYYNRGAAVNWKPMADQYYYQISFSAKDFTDVKVSAGLLYNYNAYSVQKCEYSIDGTNFTGLGTYTMTAGQTWYDNTFTLPADANHADKVYVRWIPDYTSAVVGTTAVANDGTSISNIYVTATAAIFNDGIAPVLASSVPAVSATNASTTGKVVLTFDEKVMLTSNSVVATLGGKTLTPAVSGKTITFPYTGLDYSTAYNFTLPANSVSDLAGNTLSSAVSISFTTMTRPTVAKKTFDFVVGVNGNFKAAIDAATAVSASGERFRIFFPNGDYNIGATTGDANQKTTITLPNVSFIGQSSDGVVLYNQNTTEGIGTTATMYFTNTANNLYLQDLTLKNKDYRSGTSSLGRCVALQDQGTKNIYKNVNVLSNQDTYYSGSGRLYFEGGSLHGTVDFLCGGGDVFFNECLLYLEDRAGNCITAPATASNWGYVFSGCTIDGFASTNGNYNLGRPWQNSPKSIYINTKMAVLPSAAGWTEMGVVPGLFAEYNSTTPSGTPVDISARKKSFTYSGVTTPVNPYLTAEQAANYTIENVLGGSDAWQPQLYTDQAIVPTLSGDGKSITWADNNYVLCWAVFKDGVFVSVVTTNSYTIPGTVTAGAYTVRAANEIGGLSAVSNTYNYLTTDVRPTNSVGRTLVKQTYYTIEGKAIKSLDGFKGSVIVHSVYADGHIETGKIMKLTY
ncbi:MAG: pectinesterase family protein [Paludibacter sp.]|nr:pectinesterase family protein [Paludibacter sp.]